jgi:drug/metabolite transporter (DMT)-like permease
MSELLPSFVTLSAFLIPAGVLLRRQRSRAAADIALALLTAVFCMFGGLLFAGALITLFDHGTPDLLNSALVVIGAIACLAGQQWYVRRQG